MTQIRRFWYAGRDPEMNAFDPVFVIEETAEQFGIGLRQAVIAVGTIRIGNRQGARARVETNRMIRACKGDACATRAGKLEDVERPHDVGSMDRLGWPLRVDSAKVNDVCDVDRTWVECMLLSQIGLKE